MIKAANVVEVGFIDHPTIAMCGASPDGFVDDDGLIEIKCPFSTAIHLEFLLKKKIAVEYIDQMQFQMACTGPGRKWCDFVSYDRRLPECMQIEILRVPRDDEAIRKLELEAKLFLNELDATVDLLRKRYMQEAA